MVLTHASSVAWTRRFPPPAGRAIAYGFAAHDSSPITAPSEARWGRLPARAGGGQAEALRQGPPPPSGHLPHMMGEEFEKYIRNSPHIAGGAGRHSRGGAGDEPASHPSP